MRAIEITQPGGPQVLLPCERSDPIPRAGELLVQVTASGVNRLFSHGQTPVKISDDMLANIRAQTESAMGPDAAYSMARGEDRVIALLNALSQQVTTPMPTTGPRPRAINLG